MLTMVLLFYYFIIYTFVGEFECMMYFTITLNYYDTTIS